MNPNTGQIYWGADILSAIERGKPVVEIGPEVAHMLEVGKKEIDRRRARNKQAKQSRQSLVNEEIKQ